MADYYYNESYGDPVNRRSPILRIVDYVMLFISAVSSILLVVVLFSPYVHPEKMSLIAIVGLLTPVIYLSTLLLTLFWIIRWKWRYALVMLVPLVATTPRIILYVRLDTRKHYERRVSKGEFRLMTFNLKNFRTPDNELVTDRVLDYIERVNPDVVAFQEYDVKQVKDSLMPEGYKIKNIGGQMLWSRFDIVNSSDEIIKRDSLESGSGFWADFVVREDTIRLFNIHLHSTSITSDDNDYIRELGFIRDSLSDGQMAGMLNRFKNTSVQRAHQADSLAPKIKSSPYATIVCGDFNDTPSSYAYHTIRGAFADAFAEQGSGYSYTYRGFMNLLRIDYILTSPGVEVLSYDVDYDCKLSDHYPVISVLKIKK